VSKFIYEPSGRAREYAPLAVNLYTGCPFGCTYCYVPATMRKKVAQFHNKSEVRKGVLEGLEKEAPNYSCQEVLLCFGCDPYQPLSRTTIITRDAIKILGRAGCIPVILTKSNVRQDFDLLKKFRGKLGVSLTLLDARDSLAWEPRATLPHQRIEYLKAAKFVGLKTWVSLEPVIDPEQTKELVHMTQPYVDHYKVGKLNHDPIVEKDIDWAKFAHEIKEIFDHYQQPHYIKQDLQDYIK